MKQWRLRTNRKKILSEIEICEDKNGKLLSRETTWRSGSFIIFSDEKPQFDTSKPIKLSDYEYEMEGCDDGCSVDYSFHDDEQKEFVEKFLEDNDFYDLETHGYSFVNHDTEYIIYCHCDDDIKIEGIE
jgi:hypothetical protein